jgi:hypothetical protein
VVEAEESLEALLAYDRFRLVELGRRHDELTASALMAAFPVIVGEVLAGPRDVGGSHREGRAC